MRSEFGFLKHLKDHFNLSHIGDDCAVFPKDDKHDYLITSDLLVEDIDFRLEWTHPKFIGRKALSVSISDIAAMGGTPVYSVLSIGITEALWDTGFLDDFYEGYLEFAKKVNEDLPSRHGIEVELIGGDISKTESVLTIDSTVIGIVAKGTAVYRSGAKAGDKIFVTGYLGESAFGLELLKKGLRYGDPSKGEHFVNRKSFEGSSILNHLCGPALRETFFAGNPTSMIDISDGLSSDLSHICKASGVGATLFRDKIPCFLKKPLDGLSETEIFDFALHGGEDFELLFTVDPMTLSAYPDFPFEPIGEITGNSDQILLLADGSALPLEPMGFEHFSQTQE